MDGPLAVNKDMKLMQHQTQIIIINVLLHTLVIF